MIFLKTLSFLEFDTLFSSIVFTAWHLYLNISPFNSLALECFLV